MIILLVTLGLLAVSLAFSAGSRWGRASERLDQINAMIDQRSETRS